MRYELKKSTAATKKHKTQGRKYKLNTHANANLPFEVKKAKKSRYY